MWLALTALVAGGLHALEADHVATVMTLVTRERRMAPAVRLGLVWGLGHMASVAAVGMPLLLLRRQLPPGVAFAAEGLVGLLMVALGLRLLWQTLRSQPLPASCGTEAQAPSGCGPLPQRREAVLSFATGLVHGLAGSGGAMALAVALAPSVAQGLAFLAAFGAGNAVGMAFMTLVLAVPGMWARRLGHAAELALRATVGLATIAIGVHRWESLH